MKLWRTPLDYADKAVKPGQILINKERCKGCGYCVEYCPTKALIMSEEISPKGYNMAAVVNDSLCRSCSLCEILCPEFAIKLIPGQK